MENVLTYPNQGPQNISLPKGKGQKDQNPQKTLFESLGQRLPQASPRQYFGHCLKKRILQEPS